LKELSEILRRLGLRQSQRRRLLFIQSLRPRPLEFFRTCLGARLCPCEDPSGFQSARRRQDIEGD
jgi:hypothetical protein